MRSVVVRSVVRAAVLGAILGAFVSTLAAWVTAASASTEQWEGLGRLFSAVLFGVPVTVVVSLVGVRVARVPCWVACGLVAPVVSVQLMGALEGFTASSGLGSPAWRWSAWVVGYALTATTLHLRRLWSVWVVAVATVVVVTVTSGWVVQDQRSDETAADVRAAAVPVHTTTIDGYVLDHVAATPGRRGQTGSIFLSFRPAADRSGLGPKVSVVVTGRPAWFDPTRSCDLVGPTVSNGLPCEAVAPGLWWSEREDMAIREVDGLLIEVDGDRLHPQPAALLIAAARRAHPTTVDDLLAQRR